MWAAPRGGYGAIGHRLQGTAIGCTAAHAPLAQGQRAAAHALLWRPEGQPCASGRSWGTEVAGTAAAPAEVLSIVEEGARLRLLPECAWPPVRGPDAASVRPAPTGGPPSAGYPERLRGLPDERWMVLLSDALQPEPGERGSTCSCGREYRGHAYRVHVEHGPGAEDGLCVDCFREQKLFLNLGMEGSGMFAGGFYSSAYSHAKLGGGTSHSLNRDFSMEDGDSAGPAAIAFFGKPQFQVFGHCRAFYFCHCHEAPAQPNLRAELTGQPLDALRQRLRASGALQGSDEDRQLETDLCNDVDPRTQNCCGKVENDAGQAAAIISLLVNHATPAGPPRVTPS